VPESEYQIHKAIVEWLELALPDGCVFHHSPNEGKHNVSYRMKQKRLAVRPGWPDLEIFINPSWWGSNGPWHVVFLEIKTGKGRVSKNQKEIGADLVMAGQRVHIVRSIDDCREALARYVTLKDAP